MHIDGHSVSGPWFVVLSHHRQRGVRFRLNSGRRSLSEQWALYRHYKRYGWPIAAYPSPSAPHIRVGRDDHALDIDTYVGDGADGVDRACTAHGYALDNTVRGEAWHKEIRGGHKALNEYADRLSRKSDYPVLRKGVVNPEAVRRLQRLLRGLNLKAPLNGRYDLATRRAVRRFQKKHGLYVDGVVGPKTWRLLRSASHK